MRYRTLGASGLSVSEIALGSWLTVGVGIERERAAALVDRAFELGINFIDTANVYGRGASEELLGELLAGRPRDSYILATKLYFPMSDHDRGLSAAQVAKQIDASLARLRTDYVDLYQCHRYDEDTPLEETMAALTDVVRSGKARFIGFSEWTAPQIAAAHALDGVERFVSSQPEYSILHRKPEAEVIPLCKGEGISQIVFSPLGQGVLSGKYRPGEKPPEDSRAASESMGWAMGRFLTDDVLGAVEDDVVAAVGPRQGGLLLRAHRADDGDAQGLGPLDQDGADPAGGGVGQDGLAGLDGIAAAQQELRRHALQQAGGGQFAGDAGGDLHRPRGRDRGGLGIGAGLAGVGDPVADPEPLHPLADRFHHPGRLLSEHRRELHGIEARALVGVDEVQAHGLVADQDLARLGSRDGKVDHVEDVRSAGFPGLHRQHVKAPF